MSWRALKKTVFDLRALDEPVPPDTALLLQRAGVPGFRQAVRRVNGELDRARRYQRALAVTIFAHDDSRDPSVAADDGLVEIPPLVPCDHALFPAILAALLRETTRETDIVTCTAAQPRSIVVMPETGAAEALQAVKRLRELCVARLKCPMRVGFAIFPEHGLTLEELLRYAGEDAARCVREEAFVRSMPSIQGISA